jgi:hypothetical protein
VFVCCWRGRRHNACSFRADLSNVLGQTPHLRDAMSHYEDAALETLSPAYRRQLVARHTPCLNTDIATAEQPRCPCNNWQSPSKDSSASNLHTPCSSCQHPMSDHGLFDLMSALEISHRALLVIKLDKFYNTIPRVPPAQQELLRNSLLEYKNYLRNLGIETLRRLNARVGGPLTRPAIAHVAHIMPSHTCLPCCQL